MENFKFEYIFTEFISFLKNKTHAKFNLVDRCNKNFWNFKKRKKILAELKILNFFFWGMIS